MQYQFVCSGDFATCGAVVTREAVTARHCIWRGEASEGGRDVGVAERRPKRKASAAKALAKASWR